MKYTIPTEMIADALLNEVTMDRFHHYFLSLRQRLKGKRIRVTARDLHQDFIIEEIE